MCVCACVCVRVCVLGLVFICSGLVCIFVFFCVTLDHFGFVVFNFVLLCLVFSVPSQEIGREERLRSELSSVELDVKPCSLQFIPCQTVYPQFLHSVADTG